jgi:hypothetical protein
VTVRNRYTKAVIPLNGIYTANLVFKNANGVTLSRAMTVLTGANDGKLEYQFATGELVEGAMETQVEINHTASGKKISELGVRVYQVGPKLS